jgi:hypothetical protein
MTRNAIALFVFASAAMAADAPSFDVASIRPCTEGRTAGNRSGKRYHALYAAGGRDFVGV